MKKNHDNKKKLPPRAREPVQVYMASDDRVRLDRLTEELETTKSDVLRRGLEALERQLLDPEHHPALRIIGIGGEEAAGDMGYDIAREHDRFVADSEDSRAKRKRRRGP